ncbi:MAG TPA: amino acid adenylation domain-containing protein [Thermoanaerobaculia bacterium]
MTLTDRIAALTPEQRALFEKLREKQSKAARVHQPPPVRRVSGPTGEGDWPLSLDQERFWFMEQLHPGGAGLNMAAATRMRGPVPVPVVMAALNEIVRRHAAWRTAFPLLDGAPVQRVTASRRQRLAVLDLSALPEARRESEALRLLGEHSAAAFDLERGPLVRASLVRLAAADHICLLTVHHLVADFLSFQIVWGELAVFCEAFTAGRRPVLPEPPVQYSDFAVWQREWLQGEVLESLESWWRERLAEFPLALELPTDHPRSSEPRMRGGQLMASASRELAESLRGLARQEGATLFMAVLACTAALFHRISGQERLILGANNANRNRPEIAPVVGLLLTQVPFPIDLSGDPGFRELLARVRQSSLGALAHQDLPFGKLVEAVQPERDTSRQPIIQALAQVLDMQTSQAQAEMAGVSFESLNAYDGNARYDLMLTLFDQPGGLAGPFEYDADLFDPPTARRLLELLHLHMETAAADPDLRLSDFPVLTPEARHQVLAEWNDTATPGAGWTVPHVFAAVAARTPDAPAVGHGGEVMSFGELDRRSDLLAHRLRALGVGPEVLVGIVLERSADLLVAMLGVLKSGGAYLPLDPGYPAERLAFMLQDCGVRTLISHTRLAAALPPTAAEVLPLDALDWTGEPGGPAWQTSPVDEDNLAYVVYTSGSTGRPKGVQVNRRTLANLLDSMRREPGLGPDDVLLSVASPSFDMSVPELYLPLLVGARVEIASAEEAGDGAQLLRRIRAGGATVVQATPSTWRMLLDAGWEETDHLRVAWTGAEALHPDLAAHLHRRAGEVWNLYGPTEITVWATALRIGADGAGVLPIGGPMANTRVHILDPRMRPVPMGVPGEIFIGGGGVSRGYIGRPDLTAERFVPDPWSVQAGGRLYRTGDLGRFLPDGTIDFLGRADFQVKIRSHRIELGEIEAVLLQAPGVAQAVVAARDDQGGDRRLVAYVVPADGEAPSHAELRAFLRDRLPEYMEPSAFVTLTALPLTPTRKVDRKALPAPEAEAAAGTYTAPRNPVEEVLAGIWAEVLRIERVGVDDNFFTLGGHSLLATQVATRVRQSLGVEVPVRTIFQAPTVADLALTVEEALAGEGGVAPPIRPVPRDRDLPLSFAQERLWFIDQLTPGLAAYNIFFPLAVRGDLSVAVLEAALGEVARRHESLRTTFRAPAGRPVQVVTPFAGWSLPVADLSALPAAARSAEARRLAGEEAARPFDLQKGPVLRATLVRSRPDDHALLLNIHHIAADGWSTGVLVTEVAALYRAAREGTPSPLPELPVQYADFAVWQRDWLTGEVLERQLAYWRERLAGAPTLDLPTDRPRPARGSRGVVAPLAVPAETARGLAALARREGATLFMLLLAAYQSLLGRHAAQEDVVVGSPIANRNRREIEPLIGFFVNSLVLRGDLAGDPPFREWLAQVRRTALEAYSHQDVPFERLVEELKPDRQAGRNPLFQALFALQNAPLGRLDLPGLSLAPVEHGFATTRFDLELMLWEGEEGISGAFTANADLFDPATVRRLASHFGTLLGGLLEDPGRRLSELPWLGEAERHQALREWSDTAAALPPVSLAVLFAEQAARRPDAVAVSAAEGDLTYAELDRRSGRLARRLAALGVGSEVVVALAAERSLAAIVGLLGIVKAGGVYLPLDPDHPKERLAWMMADAGARVLLGPADLLPEVPAGVRVHPLEDDPAEVAGPDPVPPSADALLYILYTSGSTGRPKGVAVTHRNVVRLVRESRFADLGPEQVFLQLAPLSFDASTLEVWAPLANGGRLVLFQRERVSLEDVGGVLEKHGITTLWLTAGLFHPMVDYQLQALRPLRQLLAGGDVLSPAHVRRVLEELPGTTLINGYGPTEMTTFTCCHPMTSAAAVGAPVPLGRPIGNTRVHILDDGLRPVPVGVRGELCAGGEGLSRGYFGRPDLTAERFVPDPFSGEPGARLYRTGDVARFLADGRIEFGGRRDGQVKLRGFRVELGEVESALARHPGVREAVVTVREDGGDRRLVAYLVPRPEASAGPDLVPEVRGWLAGELPGFMIPAAFVVLDALPLTPNGKVDRRALPAPDPAAALTAYVPPSTPLEELVAEVCAGLLGLERVGMRDNFFTLGGHSLLATQLVTRLSQEHGLPVTLPMVFYTADLGELSNRILEEVLGDVGESELTELLAEMDESPAS